MDTQATACHILMSGPQEGLFNDRRMAFIRECCASGQEISAPDGAARGGEPVPD